MTETENDAQVENGIEVYLRIRPSKKKSGYFSIDDIDENKFFFRIPKTDDIVNNSRTNYAFQFNGILDDKSTQDDVFRLVGAPAVKNVLEGFNSTIFAYGQTGSGKTFTITGGAERYVDRGIIPRALSVLFGKFKSAENVSYTCYASYLELYNESGYDLLQEQYSAGDRFEDMPKVNMMEDEDGNYHFRNLSVHQIGSEEEALNLLFLGDTNRAIGETEMNQASSRSHCIFTLMVEGRKSGSDTVVRSKLNLVDLAGSERVHKTSSTGQTLKEAKYINVSLFYLEMVIVALHERTKKGKENTHIPYRNSMMTSVLRDSLGGNCKTVMIATISPESKQTNESVSTCHFAQRVALVKNKAYVNEELEPMLVIQRLKTEIKRLREEVRFLKGENNEGEELSPEQDADLEKIIREYIFGSGGDELNIGSITLTKIQRTYSIFKKLFSQVRKDRIEMHPDECSNKSDENSPVTVDLENQLAACKKTLAQRDKEIAILVDMVKQGKGVKGIKSFKEGVADVPSKTGDSISNSNHRSSDEKKSRTIQKSAQVCGVDRCTDKNILSDPSQSLSWFRDRYSGSEAVEENKKILQRKYEEAKEVGEIVKKVRDKINYHKTTIEQLRREMAMENFLSESEPSDESQTVHPEEKTHRSAIEGEKEVYKKSFQQLRELKATIEHIQRLVEKGRIKMQKDFDRWYEEMCSKAVDDGRACGGTTDADNDDDQSHSNLSNNNNPQHTQSDASSIRVTRESIEEKADHQDTLHGQTSLYSKSHATNNDGKAGDSDFKLPPGIRLTGDKEADDDIIAFYKAKEILLARSRHK